MNTDPTTFTEAEVQARESALATYTDQTSKQATEEDTTAAKDTFWAAMDTLSAARLATLEASRDFHHEQHDRWAQSSQHFAARALTAERALGDLRTKVATLAKKWIGMGVMRSMEGTISSKRGTDLTVLLDTIESNDTAATAATASTPAVAEAEPLTGGLGTGGDLATSASERLRTAARATLTDHTPDPTATAPGFAITGAPLDAEHYGALNFCFRCPDRGACATGWPCGIIRARAATDTEDNQTP